METTKIPLSTAIFLVMGSMIGSGIFIVSADMSRHLANPMLLLFAWLLTGLITILGALCYCELASMFPKSGGQYQFLKEAYNPITAFLYGWSLFLVIQSGAIAAVAVAFSKFTAALFPIFSEQNIILDLHIIQISAAQLLAVASLFVLTYLNAQGLRYGGIVQSVLTSIKALTLLALILFGALLYQNPQAIQLNFADFFSMSPKSLTQGILSPSTWTLPQLLSALGVAMVGSMFSSDAWNNVTFIASEIKNPEKNVARALIIGVLSVTALYILANVSYLCVLPLWGSAEATDIVGQGIQHAQNDRVGTAVMRTIFGTTGGVLMAILIMISTFGANNGLILSASRVYRAMALDGLFFKQMSTLNKHGVPGFALWVQFLWCTVLCLSGQYGALLDYVMFVVVLFYILTVIGLIRLRYKQPNTHRPYRVVGYPLVPILYILLGSLFTINLIVQKPEFTLPGLLIVLLGIPAFFVWRRANPS